MSTEVAVSSGFFTIAPIKPTLATVLAPLVVLRHTQLTSAQFGPVQQVIRLKWIRHRLRHSAGSQLLRRGMLAPLSRRLQ